MKGLVLAGRPRRTGRARRAAGRADGRRRALGPGRSGRRRARRQRARRRRARAARRPAGPRGTRRWGWGRAQGPRGRARAGRRRGPRTGPGPAEAGRGKAEGRCGRRTGGKRWGFRTSCFARARTRTKSRPARYPLGDAVNQEVRLLKHVFELVEESWRC